MQAAFAFLEFDGQTVMATQDRTMRAPAAGDLSEDQLNQWFERNTAPPLTSQSKV